MCGIAGFVQPEGASLEVGRALLDEMGNSLVHRGPDGGGVWINADGAIGFVHRRLAIVDVTTLGAQPMVSSTNRYQIIFNGEIYNHSEIRAELVREGHVFRGHSDTEVFLSAIVQLGLRGALARCVGMFAVALWDARERTVSLVVDRVGEKPLYYGWVGRTFAFASELKALRKVPGWDGSLNRAALSDYLRRAYIEAPQSIYRGIAKVPPGSLLTFHTSQCVAGEYPSPTPYWSVDETVQRGIERPFSGSPAEAVGELERLLVQSTKLQMLADVPVGAFLSGGVDSSTVVALMQANSSRRVQTFSIGFNDSEFNEAPKARRVAELLGTEHLEIELDGGDAARIVADIPRIYDEPFADSSQIPTALVSEHARKNVTVCLSGDGGDELFLGYRTYDYVRRVSAMAGRFPRSARRAANRFLPSRTLSTALHGVLGHKRGVRAAKVLRMLAAPDVFEMHRRVSESDIAFVLSEDFISGGEAASRRREARVLAGWQMTQLGAKDMTQYLPGDILVKVDRAAMAASLETRIPMLDYRIVEFALSLPDNYKMRDGVGKWVLREVVARYLPKSIFEGPKRGFAVPLAAWLRGPLKDIVNDVLNSSELGKLGIFDVPRVHRCWKEHLSGRCDHHALLWKIFILVQWSAHQRRN